MLEKGKRKSTTYKGGTFGASNTGNEPYSEYYAYQIAEILGIDAVKYGLSMWKSELCSTCELFTSKSILYTCWENHYYRWDEGGRRILSELGDKYIDALHDMFVLDALICNTDRHFGNFGFLVDNETNTIIAPAPLFDHGNSLFNFAGKDVFESEENLSEYADTLLPCVYDDFIGTAKMFLHENIEKDFVVY